MVRDELSVLSAFLAVAEERSFTRAAKRIGVTQSALSHAIRGLEEQIGVRLLARTTRSVAPTEAGEQLLAHLRPALGDIRGALDHLSALRDSPAGRVRLLVSPLAATAVLAPKLRQFARDYPDVVLDVTTDESRFDLVAAGFDAASISGSSSNRTWWPCGCRRILGRPLSTPPHISSRTPSPSLRAICSTIAASTFDMDPTASTGGSSTKANGR